jgi:hypothetical protein
LSRRRPLGAALPPGLRILALELQLRALQAAVDELAEAIEELETGRDVVGGGEVSVTMALRHVKEAFVELQRIRERPIRAPRPALKRSARA